MGGARKRSKRFLGPLARSADNVYIVLIVYIARFEVLSMRTIPASEMKQRFGACIEAAQAEPILIERSGRPSVVVVSVAEYRRLQRIEDAHWGALAQQASEEGLLSDEEAAAWSSAMRERLRADA